MELVGLNNRTLIHIEIVSYKSDYHVIKLAYIGYKTLRKK